MLSLGSWPLGLKCLSFCLSEPAFLKSLSSCLFLKPSHVIPPVHCFWILHVLTAPATQLLALHSLVLFGLSRLWARCKPFSLPHGDWENLCSVNTPHICSLISLCGAGSWGLLPLTPSCGVYMISICAHIPCGASLDYLQMEASFYWMNCFDRYESWNSLWLANQNS